MPDSSLDNAPLQCAGEVFYLDQLPPGRIFIYASCSQFVTLLMPTPFIRVVSRLFVWKQTPFSFFPLIFNCLHFRFLHDLFYSPSVFFLFFSFFFF